MVGQGYCLVEFLSKNRTSRVQSAIARCVGNAKKGISEGCDPLSHPTVTPCLRGPNSPRQKKVFNEFPLVGDKLFRENDMDAGSVKKGLIKRYQR